MFDFLKTKKRVTTSADWYLEILNKNLEGLDNKYSKNHTMIKACRNIVSSGITFPNQLSSVKESMKKIKEGYRLIAFEAAMQEGKSGYMRALSVAFSATYSNDLLVNKVNEDVKVIIIMGKADNNLLSQMNEEVKNEGLGSLIETYHAANFKQVALSIDSRPNCKHLVFIDESHIGSTEGQATVGHIKDLSDLCKDLVVVMVSATAQSIRIACESEEELRGMRAASIFMDTDPSYRGIRHQDIYNLKIGECNLEPRGGGGIFIGAVRSNPSNGIYIARASGRHANAHVNFIRKEVEGIVTHNGFGAVFLTVGGEDSAFNEGHNNFNSINDALDYIKEGGSGVEGWCSNTQSYKTKIVIVVSGKAKVGLNFGENKKHLRVLYETIKSSVAGTVQGLPGRACGYFVNDDLRIYALGSSVNAYKEYLKTKPTTLKEMEDLMVRHGVKSFDNSLSMDTIKRVSVDACREAIVLGMEEGEIKERGFSRNTTKRAKQHPRFLGRVVRSLNCDDTMKSGDFANGDELNRDGMVLVIEPPATSGKNRKAHEECYKKALDLIGKSEGTWSIVIAFTDVILGDKKSGGISNKQGFK